MEPNYNTQQIDNNTARIMQVIVTTLSKRGNGINDPIRIITQYWTLDGKLLAEVDPCDAIFGARK